MTLHPHGPYIKVSDAPESLVGEVALTWGMGNNPHRSIVVEVSDALAEEAPEKLTVQFEAGDILYHKREPLKMGQYMLVHIEDVIGFESLG